MVKVAYDRELSISERKVKPGDIIHNASLILGKQIVHILPEGLAVSSDSPGRKRMTLLTLIALLFSTPNVSHSVSMLTKTLCSSPSE
jgi:nucleoporin POM152